jgi:hypothetical protein
MYLRRRQGLEKAQTLLIARRAARAVCATERKGQKLGAIERFYSEIEAR